MLMQMPRTIFRALFDFSAYTRPKNASARDHSKQQCWAPGKLAAPHGDVLLYADGSARQALRFMLTFALIERILHRCWIVDYTTASLESTLCASGRAQKNKLR